MRFAQLSSSRDAICGSHMAYRYRYWVSLAIAWLEQGAPLDIELVAALDEIAVTKSFSQGIRHRAFALARRWQCIQSAPSLSLKN